MAHLMVLAQLERDTHLPEDRVVNTFHFSSENTPPDSTDIDSVTAAVQAFYETPGAGSGANVMSLYSQVMTGEVTLKVYNWADPEPRSPLTTVEFAETPGGGSTPLPSEVALCLSYRGDIPSGSNPRNYRGRIYLGPFSTGALAVGESGGDARPSATAQDVIIRAAFTHLVEPEIPRWCVYSRDLILLVPVEHAWVDNAWDTQRRRGARPSSRVTVDRA